jgi:hypothetical protein
MPIRQWSPAITLIATAFAFSSTTTGTAWASSERLAAIPIPAALRPHLSAACQACGRHVGELIEQHRSAHELTDEEIDRATTLLYVAQSYCSLGKLLEGLTTFESISLERPKNRPLW